MNRVVILIIVALVLAGGLIVAYPKYKAFFLPNVPAQLADPYLHIPTGSDFQQVVQLLHEGGFVQDTSTFKTAAKRMNYIKANMRGGRFKIEENWSNLDLIRHLRGGQQATVKVVLTTERLPENVAAKVARFIEPDSVTLLQTFTNPEILEEFGYEAETLMSLFIPNTYDLYWNTSPRQFME
ncbi:MAG: endolytic transglycosylase MltG, partial [Phaeodactylibacter sp.]|nr:endolytic transglycosylase MltG [Phaeodactylibacter sp.]